MFKKSIFATALVSLSAAGLANAAPAEPAGPMSDNSKAALLAWNIKQQFDCNSAEPIQPYVKAEIDKIEPMLFAEVREALVILSTDTELPCDRLASFSQTALSLSETDRQLFMAEFGLEVARGDDDERRGPEGNGFRQTQLSQFNAPPPSSSSEQTSSDYQSEAD